MSERTRKTPLQIVTKLDSPTFDPPRTLGQSGQSLWNRITTAYQIADAGGIELLTLACEALDRAESLRQKIQRDGEIIATRLGFKDHPALKHELANRSFVSKTLMRLGLNVEPVRGVGRPSTGFGITEPPWSD
jgi:hypothetical protein